MQPTSTVCVPKRAMTCTFGSDDGTEASMLAVPLAVTVLTPSDDPNAADLVEADVRRLLVRFFTERLVYVERAPGAQHQAEWR